MQTGPYREIPLVKGRGEIVGWTVVDEADYEALSRWSWRLKDGAYVHRIQVVYMHREVLGLTFGDGLVGDHKDGDGLNNRRSNLRVVTHAHNCQNVASKVGSTSPYRGVSWSNQAMKWQAQCTVNGHNHYLGYFDDPLEARGVVLAFRREHLPYALDR